MQRREWEVKTFPRAVVALSLTDSDRPLLQYAALLVKIGCTDFAFVHVAPDGPEAEAAGGGQSALLHQMETEVGQYFRPGSVAGLKSVCRVLHGVRLDTLVQAAAVHRADVILLGHRQARSGRRSLARRLAMTAPCSVWLVPEGAPVTLSSMLVPTDFSEHSADALALATSLSSRAGIRECHALHVFFDPSTVQYEEHVHEVIGNEQAAFQHFLVPIPLHGVKVVPLFEDRSQPAHAILETARLVGADLIVMNTRGRSRAAAILLGSVTSDVMVETRIPVLVVKHFGAKMNLLDALLNHRTWSAEVPKTN
jgi:sulfate permease, SulP family